MKVCSEYQGTHFHFQLQDNIHLEFRGFVETLKVLYKNGLSVCDSIFGVLIIKTNT